ncbi:transglycosylase SLT domain-containing protein [Arthrobacter sp. VKM Ac-2550]|uniref:lytic transglycosylase n=1 Tax=Crystallibacter permensis TaxID=1938888 RepID=UPI002227358A|nr:transglycosylase SLT domain-containing protein [Arthrobacter sp. VKM Ac-2550]MCW2135022.1 LysM domain-containing protein [Arthrobacter sp. VKM Ac-2550]
MPRPSAVRSACAAAAAAALILGPAQAASAANGESDGDAGERIMSIRINLDALFPGPARAEQPAEVQVEPVAGGGSGEEEDSGPAPRIHEVVSGDTLSLIALQYGLDLGDIFAANGKGWDDTVIRPGQQIRLEIPAPASAPAATPAPKTGRHAAEPDLTGRAGVMELVAATAEDMGVDPALALAFAEQESGFDPKAVSVAGALGTMQVMPFNEEWASDLAGRPLDLHDTKDNITAGIAIIRHLLDTSPDQDIAIASYYQGAYGVATYGGMYQETLVYVASVKERLAKFAG